ncbi:MAG: class I poly(R)-hydroxyalkanoic acid synthase [Betaproteobacteria bacterium]|nr:MAG: class I poly(R)-hydroxyalkanoic acid synthase [Betaproteobacteria bacterium]
MQPGSPEGVLAAIAQSGNAMTQGWMRLLSSPPQLERNSALQTEYLEQQAKLWSALLAGGKESLVDDEDRRFAAREWRENPYFNYLRQSYLLAARYIEQMIDAAPLEPSAKERARFAARQWIDAMCPANFAATNPVALREALDSNGESLARGLANLVADAHRGRISQTDENAFALGRNVATTPGEVIFENELIQLIQYHARTAEVAKRPLVMIPPCINKYYILDLQPENSFVGYAVDRGHTVFMVSWRNVGAEQSHYGWDDYLELGVFTALRVAQEIAKSDKVNSLGFCVGGTLLGAALAVMAAKGDAKVASITFLAAMLDFSETGQIGLFVDEASVAAREATIGKGGILPGTDLSFVFSSLRANDLIWPYVVNNYLLGERPAAFDLLYWNADSTNLPGPMYCYYLRNTYLENKLRVPNALSNCGVPVDLGSVKLPMFGLATREDHIVPWRSAYRTVHLVGGEDKTFVLGASGHIAGVVNPASKNRRSHWIGAAYPQEPEAWLAQATEHKGSWWPRWAKWLDGHGGGKRKAPARTGNASYKPIEAAPGRYVRHRIVH